MKATAKLGNLRIAPRKVRLVADMIRGKRAERARAILTFTPKKATLPILKLLKQAMANAQNNLQLDPVNLFVAKITVDEGPTMKRWRPRSRGQAYEIQKKTSHITITLEEMVKGKKKLKKTKEVEPAVEVKPAEATEEKKIKKETPSFEMKKEISRPNVQKSLKRIFRRKAI